MGIPADYKDSDYAGKVPLSPAVSMLPLTKEQLASQECVGANQILPTEDRLSMGLPVGNEIPTADRPYGRAPIKMVDGAQSKWLMAARGARECTEHYAC